MMPLERSLIRHAPHDTFSRKREKEARNLKLDEALGLNCA